MVEIDRARHGRTIGPPRRAVQPGWRGGGLPEFGLVPGAPRSRIAPGSAGPGDGPRERPAGSGSESPVQVSKPPARRHVEGSAFRLGRGRETILTRRILSLTPLDAILERIRARVAPVAAEAALIGHAVGLVLAAPLRVPANVPTRALAAVDGWAVAADMVVGAAPGAPVFLAERPAAVEIGDAMPDGTDAVLPPEAVAEAAGFVEISAAAGVGEGVRPAGFDGEAGAVVLAAGRRLTPLAAAAARSVGLAEAVVRRPYVRILVIGDGLEPQDVTGRLIADLVVARGAELDRPAALADDPAVIAGALAESVADLIITVGGSGVGTTDRTLDGIGLAAASEVLAHGIAIAPGETTALAMIGDAPVLVLPGRPDAALAGFLLVGLPLIDRLAGADPALPDLGLPLAGKVSSALGMTELRFMALENGQAVPLAASGLPLGRLGRADGYLVVPARSEGFPAGALAGIYRLPGGRSW